MRSSRRHALRTWVAVIAATGIITSFANPSAQATATVQNFMRATNQSSLDVRVYPYSGGTARLFDVAADWAAGTSTNTAVNPAGDLVLASTGGLYAASGTWESPTIDSGG